VKLAPAQAMAVQAAMRWGANRSFMGRSRLEQEVKM
jgi:hypothetical protein